MRKQCTGGDTGRRERVWAQVEVSRCRRGRSGSWPRDRATLPAGSGQSDIADALARLVLVRGRVRSSCDRAASAPSETAYDSGLGSCATGGYGFG